MYKALLYRTVYKDDATLGNISVYEVTEEASKLVFKAASLELPPRNNMRGVSAIPPGEYDMRFEYSRKFRRKLWELKGVEARSEIKIHVGNYITDTRGCILLGDRHYGAYVRNSMLTLSRLHDILENEEVVKIKIV